MAFNRSATRKHKATPEAPRAAPRPQPKPAPPDPDTATAEPSLPVPEPLDGEALPPLQGDIPSHVWTMLQQGGELAARRLVELLASPRFKTYSPAAQRGLIELALTRAYGLPIRRALTVNLSSTDADAVAASIMELHGSLPEHGPSRATTRAAGPTIPPDDAELAQD